ncbi:hypothetical protein NDU88_000010 [Pleurodeles waltl]|uniref:Uncharacterized protein n=1 Tax=Pleurodeles waltl TaxID=8319 RepID=A0AAV7S5U9_PLEWA|nr:hypothetical protein NDU88_000010 [Pleurodeles waltl]
MVRSAVSRTPLGHAQYLWSPVSRWGAKLPAPRTCSTSSEHPRALKAAHRFPDWSAAPQQQRQCGWPLGRGYFYRITRGPFHSKRFMRPPSLAARPRPKVLDSSNELTKEANYNE